MIAEYEVLSSPELFQAPPGLALKVGETCKCRIDDLIIPSTTRPHDDASVRLMAESLESVGQQVPLIVTLTGIVHDGVLRLLGARLAEWTEIEVRVPNANDRLTELAAIDANAIRPERTPLDLALLLVRRQEIYEAEFPDTKYGSRVRMQKVRKGEGFSEDLPCFTTDVARMYRWDPRKVQNLLQIGKGLREFESLLRRSPSVLSLDDLLRLVRCPDDGKLEIAERLATGELTAVPKDAGRRKSWTPPDPDAVLRRVKTILTGRLSGQPDADVGVIPAAIREIQVVRSMWEPPTDEPDDLPPSLSLEEIDRLAPGQLSAWWLSRHAVQIVKDGVPIAYVRVRRAARTDECLVDGVAGHIRSCSLGDGDLGDAQVVLPDDGDPCLDGFVSPDRADEIITWRDSCESWGGDLSISLGILQRLAETNRNHRFTTVCSGDFRPSDSTMAWLAAMQNVVVGHVVQPASPAKLESQFAAIQRYVDWGIPTAVWVTTDRRGEHDDVLDRAVAMVGADNVILKPSRRRPPGRTPSLDGTGPLNVCSGECSECQIRCGLTTHGMMEPRQAVEPQVPPRTASVHTPFPSPDRQWYEVLCCDAREFVRSLERQVHCVLTSPPICGTKACGDSALDVGRERDPREYVETLCDIFDAIPLHPECSLWVNLRDSRSGSGRVLLGLPELLTLAMQERGWLLLDRVVWAKAALLPDGTTHGDPGMDRSPWRLDGNGHEHLLRLARTDHPWADDRAVGLARRNADGECYLPGDRMVLPLVLDGPTPPNVWLFGPGRGPAAHVTTVPLDLCEIPIALTCPLWVNPDGSLPRRPGVGDGPDWVGIDDAAEPGFVLDPFCGVGTTGVVALRLGRSFLGCELYDDRCHTARSKLNATIRQLSGDLSVDDARDVTEEE